MLITKQARDGQRTDMFLSASCLLSWLKALDASTSTTASVSKDEKTSASACTAASQPAGWPAHSLRGPAAARMS